MNETQEMNPLEVVEATGETLAESVIATVDPAAAAQEALEQMHTQVVALEGRVEALSERIAALEQASARRVEAAAEVPARKTMPAGVSTLLSKHGLGSFEAASGDTVHAMGRVDAALTALPVEQRIAIKSELLRAGLL